MLGVDRWRQNEAEVRQEMPKRTCADCGSVIDDCDARQCDVCKDYFCYQCFQGVGEMCPVCKADYESEAEE